MTQEEYESLKKSYIAHIQQYIKDVGNLFPHITVFADHIKKTEETKLAIVHIPIADEFMENDETKDYFIKERLPEAFKSIKEEFVPTAVAWGSEAWVRVMNTKEKHPENYKDIPIKKEVIFVSIETENSQETIIYDIKRDGKQVNPDGSITDIIQLTEAEESGIASGASGRFTGLFKMLENL